MKYWAIFKTQLLNRLAYLGDLLPGSITIILFMWIFLQLWRATYSSVGQTSISGLTLPATMWYLMLAETIVLSKPRLSRVISEAVKDGSIAYLLNKPYNFILYQISISLGNSLTQMIFNLLAGGAVVWVFVGPPPDARGWPMVMVAMTLGWLIDFCFQALIGLAAFVTEDVTAFDWIYSKFVLLLGGVLIPLDFFPTWLRAITQALPFAYSTYGPARLFVEPELARFGMLVLGQMAWLAVMGAVLTLFYRRSVGWLSINGG